MSIIIPSGNIYEINHTPIKNNIINSIEVPVKEVSTVYDENTIVYSSNTNIEDSEITVTAVEDSNQHEALVYWDSAYKKYYWERISNNVYIILRKITVNSFTIPKVSDNKKITKLTDNKIKFDFSTKVDYYENADAYNVTGDTFDEPTKSFNQNGLFVNDINAEFTFQGKIANNQSPFDTDGEVKSKVNITNNRNANNINFSVTSSGSFSGTIIQPITSTQTLSFESEKEVQEEGDYYVVPSFTVLCGYDARINYIWEESNEVNHPDTAGSTWTTKESRVTRYNVIPVSMNINLNGNTISIDLKDKVQLYGDTEDRKNSYKANGNELIQSTNTYNGTNAIEKFAQEVLTQYNNGKETVELLCSIGNYFDENKNLVIGTKKSEYETVITFESIQPFQGKYLIGFSGDLTSNTDSIRYKNETYTVDYSRNYYVLVDENTQIYKDYAYNTTIQVTALEKLARMFNIDDEVIPYIYTAYGKDVPLSIDKNGNAKVFKVVGFNFSDSGIVFQKITLQEK